MSAFVSLTGNLTREVSLHFGPSGMAFAEFGVAVNRRWRESGSAEWQEQVSFFDVKAFGKLAENVGQSLQRGDRVTVTGSVRQDTWEKDGQERRKERVYADDVAVSLARATVSIEKNPRAEGARGRPASEPPPGYGDDEEPF